ncbi:DUF4113 domain-containing protein [Turicimonas muris]
MVSFRLEEKVWCRNRERLSVAYTTCWNDLPKIGALCKELIPS